MLVAVGAAGLPERMAAVVAGLAGTGDRQHARVTVVHVSKVWGTSLGLQHPALRPSARELLQAQELVARAVQDLRRHDVAADALVSSGRHTGKALAGTAQRAGATMIVVGRSGAGRLERLLRGQDPAHTLLDRASCTLVVVDCG